ncbi:MAG: carboxymuconolactone decarboxylase family protein [Thermodesulfobacteriota bacterium]
MAGHPLDIFEKIDPEFLKVVKNNNAFAFADGALPKKVKLLIAMVFDASHGSVQGVKSLTQKAMQSGATKEEVMEALKVAQYMNGVGIAYTAANAFKDLF